MVPDRSYGTMYGAILENAKELGQFIDKSKTHATGWIGFYWGKKPDEYRKSKTIRDAIVLSWLELFQEKGKTLGR